MRAILSDMSPLWSLPSISAPTVLMNSESAQCSTARRERTFNLDGVPSDSIEFNELAGLVSSEADEVILHIIRFINVVTLSF